MILSGCEAKAWGLVAAIRKWSPSCPAPLPSPRAWCYLYSPPRGMGEGWRGEGSHRCRLSPNGGLLPICSAIGTKNNPPSLSRYFGEGILALPVAWGKAGENWKRFMMLQGNTRFFVPTFGGRGGREDGKRPRLCTPGARRVAAEPPGAPSPPRCGRWCLLGPAPGAPKPAPTPSGRALPQPPQGRQGSRWRRVSPQNGGGGAGRAGCPPPAARTRGRETARCGAAPPRPPAARRRDQRLPARRGASSAPHAARLRRPPSSPAGGCPAAVPLPASPRSTPSAPRPSAPPPPAPPEPRTAPVQPLGAPQQLRAPGSGGDAPRGASRRALTCRAAAAASRGQ